MNYVGHFRRQVDKMPIQPMLSVIMPTYNYAAFIREAIESVLNQSYRNFELIVVDNYSQDDTQQIVESFKDERIRYHKFFNNGVIGASRNYGIREARGQYAAFIDSDDIWFSDKLRQQIGIMEQDNDCQMVFCPFQIKNLANQIQNKILGPRDLNVNGYIYDKLIKYNFIVSSSVVLRKKVLNDVGFFDESQELSCAEDFDLWLRIARNYKVLFVPNILGMYRIHDLNANVDKQRLKKALNVIDKHFALGLATKKETNRAKANFYLREGWFSMNQNVQLARSYFLKAYQLNFYNLRIFVLSLLGLGISLSPFIYTIIRRKDLDRKLSHLFLNPQNL